jgi:hypothetical protein
MWFGVLVAQLVVLSMHLLPVFSKVRLNWQQPLSISEHLLHIVAPRSRVEGTLYYYSSTLSSTPGTKDSRVV